MYTLLCYSYLNSINMVFCNKSSFFASAMIGVCLSGLLIGECFAENDLRELVVANENYMIEIYGNDAGEQFGSSMVVGDFNGDGIEDFVAGAPFASSSLKEWNGKASMFFGEKEQSESIVPNVNFYGEFSGDQLGMTMSAGDLNGDGIDDLVLGAYNGIDDGVRTGKVYVIYGKELWNKKSFDLGLGGYDKSFTGLEKGDNYGLAISVLDINGDEMSDLIVGAPNSSSGEMERAGRVFVYLSDLKNKTGPDFAFSGNEFDEKFGSYIDGGDISGDGKVDLLISAYQADCENDNECGRVYIYNNVGSQNGIIPVSELYIEGDRANDWFGFYFDISDIDNDGVDDLAVSSFPYATVSAEGMVYVFYGGQDWMMQKTGEFKAGENANFSFGGRSGGNLPGAYIELNDLDGDAKEEIIIGAPGVGHPVSADSGNIYIFDSEISEELGLKDAEVTVYGENADDWFGYRVETIDFNLDGFKDLLVGARYADSSGGVNHGKVYVLWGSDNYFGKTVQAVEREKVVVGEYVNRGEAIKLIVEEFELIEKNSALIESCYAFKEFCFFDFMARSSFDGVKLEADLVLYPDVDSSKNYYEAVNVATILGLVNGYMESEDSPFLPDVNVTRIQALKVILGAAGLVEYKYQFELKELLGSASAILEQVSYFVDIDTGKTHMWWYPRYVNFAVENGMVEEGELFRPDDMISGEELMSFIEKTKIFISDANEETES